MIIATYASGIVKKNCNSLCFSVQHMIALSIINLIIKQKKLGIDFFNNF